MKYIPKPYQRRATECILRNKKYACHIDMGLGKTVATLTAIKQLIDEKLIKGVLIFAPLRVATLVWPDEIAKWDHVKHLTHAVVRGFPVETVRNCKVKCIGCDGCNKKQERVIAPNDNAVAALNSNANIIIANYDIMDQMCEWIIEHREHLPFDMLVLDESSKLKSSASTRFKTFKSIAISPLFKRIVELTGTPMPERYEDLWSQYYLLDSGKRLMPYITHFRSRWMVQNPYNRYDRKIRPGADKEIEKRIEDITVAMRAEDYIKLPGIIVNDIDIELPQKIQDVYDQVESELVSQVKNDLIVASNTTIMYEKCRQIVSGFVYNEDGNAIHLHDEKTEALKDLLDEVQEPVMVAYWYKEEESRIKKNWPNAPILGPGISDKKAKQIVDAWNGGKHQLMFMHPASVGHGVNLQVGGHIIVFMSLPWSNDMYRQTIARLHRMGQKRPVFVHRLIAKGTVDERVASALENKENLQVALLKGLTRLVEG